MLPREHPLIEEYRLTGKLGGAAAVCRVRGSAWFAAAPRLAYGSMGLDFPLQPIPQHIYGHV
jgi:hypothetical protein